jgi:hypothetical protein
MKLEDLIKDNKKEFEQNLPDGIWESIDQKVNKKPFFFNKNLTIFKVAAGIILCLSLGFLVGKYNKSASSSFVGNEYSPAVSLSLVNYSQTVKQKRENLQYLKEKMPELHSAFATDLAKLEENFVKLKSELPQNPNRDQLIDAMIQNLLWQIDLLNKQTEIAKNVNNAVLL